MDSGMRVEVQENGNIYITFLMLTVIYLFKFVKVLLPLLSSSLPLLTILYLFKSAAVLPPLPSTPLLFIIVFCLLNVLPLTY